MFDPDNPKRIVNYRPLFSAAVGFIAGLAAYRSITSIGLNTAGLIALLAAIGLAAAALIFVFARHRQRILCVLIAAFLFAFIRMPFAAPDEISAGSYELTGTVKDISNSQANTVVLTRASLNGSRLRYNVKLRIEGDRTPEIGETIKANCEAKLPSARFDNYNERLTLLASGISVKAECEGYETISEGSLPVTRKLASLKSFLSNKISELFPDNAPIVTAFLLGDRSGVDESDIESFRSSGAIHLLTISGLHVGVLTAALFFILPKRYPILRLGVISAFLVVYCALTAFSPSLVRASVMSVSVLLADVAEEKRDPLSSLSLAALVILIVSPYKFWSVGFRLSFAACFGIFMLIPPGYKRSLNGPVGKLLDSALVTLGATAATAMISAHYFGTFPTYGLLSNLIAVPLFSIVIILSFVSVLVGIVSPSAGAVIAFIPDKMINTGVWLLDRIRSLPYSELSVIPPSTLTCALMLVLLFVISPYVLRPVKQRIKFSIMTLLIFTASLFADIIKA